MNGTNRNTLAKVLAFAAVLEIGTGLALLADPAIIVMLLLGADVSGTGILLARCFGIALLALGVACWPGRQRVDGASPVLRGMLAYNAMIALYLAYLGVVGHYAGLLLWPAVVLHGVVALLLAWKSREG